MRQWSCRGRCRHVSYCWVRLWLSRLMVLPTSSSSQQGCSHFPDLMGTHSGYEHLGKSFGKVRFIATKPLKCLRVKPTFPISGYVDILNTTCGCHQITTVGAIAIAFPFRAAFSPRRPNERI